MGKLSNKSTSHVMLMNFVDWIRPEESTEEKIRKQADEIRDRIKGKASEDRLTVQSMPWSGSFAKKTGLRRHMRGDHEVEGQDIDLPFVVSPKDEDGKALKSLLDRFERYAKESYPNTARTRTKSSICMDFVGTKLSYDLVPMLAVERDDNAQILIRNDGQRRKTSVQQHIDFIKKRTDESNKEPGRVKFNEGVRLVKWWREMRQADSAVLPEVPTMLIDLLCARAFDRMSVAETYTETLSQWFGLMANIIRGKKTVQWSKAPPAGMKALWVVLDPVNEENNVVPSSWGNLQLDELTTWFENARDGMARVIAAEVAGQKTEVEEELTALFGGAVKAHGSAS
ncbi:MAG: CBASS oligonucleotide cyclase [Byssovorax sp.]